MQWFLEWDPPDIHALQFPSDPAVWSMVRDDGNCSPRAFAGHHVGNHCSRMSDKAFLSSAKLAQFKGIKYGPFHMQTDVLLCWSMKEMANAKHTCWGRGPGQELVAPLLKEKGMLLMPPPISVRLPSAQWHARVMPLSLLLHIPLRGELLVLCAVAQSYMNTWIFLKLNQTTGPLYWPAPILQG